MAQLKTSSIIVCNLHPFTQTTAKPNCTLADAVEEIDIGGVTLLRAAAKNRSHVSILSDPADYTEFLEEWKKGSGDIGQGVGNKLALKAFEQTARYDAAISRYFREQYASTELDKEDLVAPVQRITLAYGANPHQTPAQTFVDEGKLPFKALCGAPGHINLLDALSSYALVKELQEVLGLPASALSNHVSPAGAAVGIELNEIEERVYGVDDLKNHLPLSLELMLVPAAPIACPPGTLSLYPYLATLRLPALFPARSPMVSLPPDNRPTNNRVFITPVWGEERPTPGGSVTIRQ